MQHKIDFKTKPLGALGALERVALKIGRIQDTLSPQLRQPAMLVFAGDHGLAREGVSPYPQEVTYQMVFNFLAGGAAINVFCRQNGIDIKVVDAGVNFDFEPHPALIDAKIAKGTQSALRGPAMTTAQCEAALAKGAALVQTVFDEGCNVIGFGEMGIGNTSAAALLMSVLGGIPIADCVGRGTGLDDAGLARKKEILAQALANNPVEASEPLAVLATFGGFEIAMMAGAMLKAAELKMVVLVDGFISSAALLAARAFNPHVPDYCIFTHQSHESGHQKLLALLGAEPLVNLEMRLGEGSGAAVAYPLVVAAVNFLNQMASFESANVSQKSE
ncbi:MAG: Nicotinate-nucleotide--dimethylbenzimidazole phosphoribosyltransferase [Anaerolineae bacterium]|nr:Nicotinate-nucleotide--dimethylbenzimidazole phosphoribosyltransferase [Anaerolineae bacterium]